MFSRRGGLGNSTQEWRSGAPIWLLSVLLFSINCCAEDAHEIADQIKKDLPKKDTTAQKSPSSPKAPAAEKRPSDLYTLSIEELMNVQVSTISRVSEPLSEAPGSVYVYSRDIIQKRGYRSLGELLQTVPGFTVFHKDLDFVTGVRGLNANDNDKISLLVNGQLVLGLHEQEFLNGPINLDNVDRVEVVVGPSSFFQQANTLAATVNVITKNTQGVELMAATGNDLRYSSTIMAGKRWADDKFINFSFTTENKKGFDAWEPDFQPGLAGRTLTGELDWPSYFSVLNGKYGEVTAQATAYRTSLPELHIDNASLQNDGEMVEQFYSVYVKDEHQWTPTLTSVARFDVALKEQTRLNNGGPPADSVEQIVHQWVYESDLGLRYSGFTRHLLQAGVQGNINHNFDTFFTFNDNATDEHIPRTTLVDHDSHGVGFYADDEFKLSDRVELIGGVRFDNNSKLKGSRWFPGARAALITKPKDFWISKLLYNRAVRMPSDLEALNKVWGSGHVDDPNSPSFARLSPQPHNPEILSTVELQNIFNVGPVRLGTTVYHQELQDFLTWFSPHSNGGNFRGNGVELSLQAQAGSRLTVWSNGSFNDSVLHLFRPDLFGPPTGAVEEFHAYVNKDSRIIGSTKYTSNLGLDYKILDNLTFSPSARYFTGQSAVDFHPPVNGVPQSVFRTIHDRVYVDAGISWEHVRGKNLDLHLYGHNVLENRRPVGAMIEGDTYRPRGREVIFSFSLRF